MDNVTLLVSTFDGYSMCWGPFCHGLRKYWPNHPKKVLFITNFKEPECGEALKVGQDRGWSGNLLAALEEIDSPYVLYAQEDYWINQPVPEDHINFYLALLEKDEADYIRLYPAPPPDLDFPLDSRLGAISSQAKYRTSLQMGLWRKTVFQDLLLPHETAWDFEVNAAARSRKYGLRFLCVTKRRYGVGYTFTAIVNGEWSQAAREYALKEGIKVDFAALPRKKLLKYCLDTVKGKLYGVKKRILRGYEAD